MPRGTNLSDQIKKIIIDKYQSGVRQVDIAKQLNLHKSVVCKQIKLYQSRSSVSAIPKPGRPKKTTLAEDKLVKRCSIKYPFMTAGDIKKENPSLSISVRSIRRRLCQQKLNARRPCKKPYISKKKIDGRDLNLLWNMPPGLTISGKMCCGPTKASTTYSDQTVLSG